MFVWSKRCIRFKGERFKACAQDNGENLVMCTPIVFDDGIHCGVGIIVENEVLRWGLFAPRDYIASWRAGEILRALGQVTSATVRGAFYAGSRSLNSNEELSYTTPVIEKIGSDEYRKIMSLPVPNEIVRAILDNRVGQVLKPNLYPLSEEVEAGTLQWREEFTTAGVLTPEEYRARNKKCEEAMFETDDYLRSMIDVVGIERMSIGIHEIRDLLAILFEKKVNEKYPSYALVALAVIMSDTTIAQASSFKSFKILEEVCQWVSRTSGYPRINLFGIIPKKEGALSPQESSDLLQELINRYFPIEKNLMGL